MLLKHPSQIYPDEIWTQDETKRIRRWSGPFQSSWLLYNSTNHLPTNSLFYLVNRRIPSGWFSNPIRIFRHSMPWALSVNVCKWIFVVPTLCTITFSRPFHYLVPPHFNCDFGGVKLIIGTYQTALLLTTILYKLCE